MKKTLTVAIALAINWALPAMAAKDASAMHGPADLIMTNGHIKTPTGWATAMAVRNSLILAVGPASEVVPLRGQNTKLLDLKGETVLPGLHDLHVHPVYAGLRHRQCSIPQGSTLQQTLGVVKTCVAKAKEGAWIIGGQWDAPALGGIPNRQMLDKISEGHPIFLEDTSGHSAWLNSKALAMVGVSHGTPNPKGGIIERDASGAPSGILREVAMDMASSKTPKAPEEEVQAALAWSLHKMLSYGITSFTEAAVGFTAGPVRELKAYDALADSGVLKQRVRLCMVWSPNDKTFESLFTSRNFYARERLSPDCIKIFLDGVPTDSHTAAMLEPYQGTVAGRDDKASRYGMTLIKPEVLNKALIRFDSMGLTVKFHSVGDAAVREGLTAIEAARKANGYSGRMHNVGHCTFVSKSDIPRARKFGATFEVSPYLWGPTPINDAITAAVGDKLIKRVWPVREMIDSGALVVPGSDWSVVPSVNPWIGMEELVTREKPGGSKESFGKGEAITLDEAFQMFTVNSSRQKGMSNKTGEIAPGMLADVIVVNQNPFAVPVTRIHATKVLMTFIGGEKVYDSTAPQPNY